MSFNFYPIHLCFYLYFNSFQRLLHLCSAFFVVQTFIGCHPDDDDCDIFVI